jgi:fructose-bisphosphate aldolase/2-amino-3,7-dideoxy-D-threo-hept-6-ulosonate synthase
MRHSKCGVFENEKVHLKMRIMDQGKKRRLARIFREDGKTVIVPMDHGVTIGPIKGLANMQETINKLLKGEADAFVVHKGIAKNVDVGKAGLIVHLSGITKLGLDPDNKVQVCTVEEALRIGADAVSVHINVGAKEEAKMLEKLGKVADDCDRYGMPLLAMMYPRGPKIQNEHDADLVAHAARLGSELGADIIKTNYTGNIETFKMVAQSCLVPVIIAGGLQADSVQDVLQMVKGSLNAGGVGVSIGRNVFQHENPALIVEALCSIVHHGATVEETLKILGESS